MIRDASCPQTPFVLSLSKDRSYFVRLRARPEEQERCFDKLSTNGFGLGCVL